MPTLEEDLIWLQDTLYECTEDEAYEMLEGYINGAKEYEVPITEYVIFICCFMEFNIC